MSLVLRDLTSLTLESWIPTVILSDPPEFTNEGSGQVTVGNAYSHTPTATDPDGDAMTLTVTTLPSWMAYSNGTLSGTPGYADTGANLVVLALSDGESTVEQIFSVLVVPSIAPGRHFPVHLVEVKKTDKVPKNMPALPYGAEVDYGFDWTRWLPVDDTIVYSEWVAIPALPLLSPYLSGVITSNMVNGATVGTKYLLTNKVLTAQGRTVKRSMRFTCKVK